MVYIFFALLHLSPAGRFDTPAGIVFQGSNTCQHVGAMLYGGNNQGHTWQCAYFTVQR